MDELSDTPSLEEYKDTIDIDPNGDLVLQIRDYGTGTDHEYRVSKIALQSASHYFSVLLDPSKFSEGIAVDRTLKAICGLDGAIPFRALPRISLPDIGPVPQDVSTQPAVELFLRILHSEESPWPTPRASFVAVLAIIADRFAATTPIANYVIHRKWKSKLIAQKGSNLPNEARVRQLLLIGLILRFPDWARQYSAMLIVQGSEKWTAQNKEVVGAKALWWSLPNGLEGELQAAKGNRPSASLFRLLPWSLVLLVMNGSVYGFVCFLTKH